MTKVEIHAGVCGFVTTVSADSEDGQMVHLTIESGCPAVRAMAQAMPEELDAYEVCFQRPGTGPLYELSSQHLAGHAGLYRNRGHCEMYGGRMRPGPQARLLDHLCGLTYKKIGRREGFIP